MKHNIVKQAMILGLALCFGCGQKADNSSGTISIDDAISKAEGRRATDPDASGGNTCLLEYQTRLDQLLTEKMVLDATGFSKNVMKVKYNKVMRPEHHSVAYTFANKRTGTPFGAKTKYELPDLVSLKNLKAMSRRQFEASYRAMTAEEEQAANDAIRDVSGQASGSKETEQAMGTIKDAFKTISKSWVSAENIGDMARWNTVSNELMVLDNGVQFGLAVEISNDNVVNKDIALKVAAAVLEKCK